MTHTYFLRKLTYLNQQYHPKAQWPLIKSEKASLLLNFKHCFQHYSQNQHLIDSYMQCAYRDRVPDPTLWSMYGAYLMTNWDKYKAGEMTHIANMLVKYEVPSGFLERLERKALAGFGDMTNQEIAMACKQTQGEALMKKVRDEGKLKVENDLDLFFFTSAYIGKKEKFSETVEFLKGKLAEMIPKMTDAIRLCQILREYSESHISLPPSTISAVETALLSENMQFYESSINEILLTLHSKQYTSLVSTEFWQKFEQKVTGKLANYRASRLLSTFARRSFPSTQVMAATVPVWVKDVERLGRKEVFREGFCALMKYTDVSEETKQWCLSQSVYFRQHFDSFDIATMLRAAVVPGWYSPVLWQVLVDRFFSPVISPPKDLDKSMVYFALKSMEIDEVKLPNLPKISKEDMSKFREIYEKTRFHKDRNRMHLQTASALTSLALPYQEFAPVAHLYAPNFLLPASKLVIQCFDWAQFLSPLPRTTALGTKMMLRHLNKSGWSVLLVANDQDLPRHLSSVMGQIGGSKAVRNLQVV